jgi:hypothetical protein
VLKVNNFNVAKNKLDEWIYFLKNTRIERGFSAKGLLKAQKTLDYTKLSKEEQAEYDYIQESKNTSSGTNRYSYSNGRRKRQSKRSSGRFN